MTKPSAALRDLCSELELSEYMLRKFMKVFQKERKTALDDTAESHTFLPSFVFEVPSGEEKGRFLTLDIEGIPVRVVLINLKRKSFDLRAKQFMLPQDIMRGSGEQFFDFLAQRVNQFACENKVDEQGLPLGITISFPIKSTSIKSGSLIRWTKGFSCDGVINENFCEKLQEAIWKLEDLRLDVCALVTDSTATLLAAAWKADKCKIGLNIGTGTNISYVESMKKIAALSEYTLKFHNIIINTEYGNMGVGGSIDFIRTGWDRDLDNATVQPGLNMLEKMISSIYLGEFVRRVLVTATQRGVVFRGAISERLLTVGSFEPNFLIDLGEDWTSQRSARNILNKLGYPMPWSQDCVDLQYVCQVVWTRSAHLVAASVAALLCSLRYANVSIGVDGTFYRAHPGYPEALNKKLRELTDPQISFQFVVADDGGGLGGALAANMSNKDNYLSRGASEQRRDSFFAKFDIENISSISNPHNAKSHSSTFDMNGDTRQKKQNRKSKNSSPTPSGERLQAEKKKKGSYVPRTSSLKSTKDDVSRCSSESSATGHKSKRASPDKPRKPADYKQDSRESMKTVERSSKKPDHQKDESKQQDESGAKRKSSVKKNGGSKSSDDSSRKGGSTEHRTDSKGVESKKDSHDDKSRDSADGKKDKSKPESPKGRRGTSRASGRGAPSRSEDSRSLRSDGGGPPATTNRNRRGRAPPSSSHHTPGNPGTEDEGSDGVNYSSPSSAEHLQELKQNKIGINLHKRSTGNPSTTEPDVERKSITPTQSANKSFEVIPTTWESTVNISHYQLHDQLNSTDSVATKNRLSDRMNSKEQHKFKEFNDEMNKKRSDSVIKGPKTLSRTSKIEFDKGSEVQESDKKQSKESKMRMEASKEFEKSSKSSSINMKRGKSSAAVIHLPNLTDEDGEDLPVKKPSNAGKGPEEKHTSSKITNGKLNEETGHERNLLNERSMSQAERQSSLVTKDLLEYAAGNKSGEKASKRSSSINTNTSKQETKSPSTPDDDKGSSRTRQSCTARSSRDSRSITIDVGEVGRRNSKRRSEKLDEELEVKGDSSKSLSEATGSQQRSTSISKTEIKNPKISGEESSPQKKNRGKTNASEKGEHNDKKVHAEESSPKNIQRSDSLFVKSEKQVKNSDTYQGTRKSLKQSDDEISSPQKRQGSVARLDKKESPGKFSNASFEGGHKGKKTSDEESSTSKKNQSKNAHLDKRETLTIRSDTSAGTRKNLNQPYDENQSSQKRQASIAHIEKRESQFKQTNTADQESVKSPGGVNCSSKNAQDTNKEEQNSKGKSEKLNSTTAMNDEKLPFKSNEMLGKVLPSDKQEQRRNEIIYNVQQSRQKIINSRCSEENNDLSKMHQLNDSPLENVSEDNRRSFISQTSVEEYATNDVKELSEEGKKQIHDSLAIKPDGLYCARTFPNNATTRNTSNSLQDDNLPVMERQASFVHLSPVSKTFPAKGSDAGKKRNEVRHSGKMKEKLPFKSDERFSRINKTENPASGITASKFSTINSTSNRRLAEMTQLSRISLENAIESTVHQ